MPEEERFFLKQVVDFVRHEIDATQSSITHRINLFILLISFIVLAEATIIAGLLDLPLKLPKLWLLSFLAILFFSLVF